MSFLAGSPDPPLPENVKFASPNGDFSVQFRRVAYGSNQDIFYQIENNQTGSFDRVRPSVPLYLHWALDSRAIVTVEHIPHGSCGRVIFLESQKWHDVEVRPQMSEYNHSTVIGLTITEGLVCYKFAVHLLPGYALPDKFAFCDIKVRLDDGEVVKTDWATATRKEGLASLERKPSYNPPSMENRGRGKGVSANYRQ